jgi:hypothetical protein
MGRGRYASAAGESRSAHLPFFLQEETPYLSGEEGASGDASVKDVGHVAYALTLGKTEGS